jgi:(1->4)-alpha-D-glucan 1-alpha-D-glucosylmutase
MFVKAVREAKVHTAWLRPDESYEQGYLTFIERILDTNRENSFLRDFLPFHRRIVWYGMFNSLSQVTLKATCPGIPDFYQGTELWDLSLVDPDNRHEVDYGRRRSMLAELTAREGEDPFALLHELLMNLQDGRAKLYLIQKLLAARKTWPGAFQRGEYVPLGVHGQHRNSVLAFARQAPESMVAVVVPRLLTNVVVEGVTPTGMQVWGDTCVEVPTEGNHPWQHAITGGHINAARMVAVGELLQHFPVAVLAQTAT